LQRPRLSSIWKGLGYRGGSRNSARLVARARFVAQQAREAQVLREQERRVEELRSAFEWLRAWTPEHRYLLAFFRQVKREVLALRWAAERRQQLDADFVAESKEPAYPQPRQPEEPQQTAEVDLKRLAQYFAVGDRAPTKADLATAALVPLDAELLADCVALTTKLAALTEHLRRAVPSLPTELGDGFAIKLWDRRKHLVRTV
jgi:hypothetical protein